MRKKSASIILTLVLAISMLLGSMSVSAAPGEIDTGRKGSVTLYKYEAGTKNDNNSGVPVAGAGFSFYQILSYDANGYRLTDLAISAVQASDPQADLDDIIDSIVITSGQEEQAGDDGYAGYGSTGKLEGLIADFNAYINENSVKADTQIETGINGSAMAQDLPLGVYLVTETTVPNGYIASTAPFLVSVPYWENNDEGWQYDVTAYPKDQTFEVEKSITEEESSLGSASYEIGDKVTFAVKSTIPDYGNSYNNTSVKVTKDRTIVTEETYAVLPFVFTDTLSGGLTFDSSSLTVTVAGRNPATLKLDDDATYDKEEGTVTWSAGTDAGDYYLEASEHFVKVIVKWDSIDQYQGNDITFSYSATVNEDAVVTDGNTNSATISVANNPATFSGNYSDTTTDEYTSSTDTSTVYTYQLGINKTFNGEPATDAQVNASAVKFTVSNQKTGGTNYKFIQKTDTGGTPVPGEYVLWTGATEPSGKTLVTELAMSSDGTLTITGLENNTYYLTETETVGGYSVLAKPVPVKVTDVESSETKTTIYHPYIAYDASDFQADTTYYTLTDGAYTEINSSDYSNYVSDSGNIRVVYYAETKTVTGNASSNVEAEVDGGQDLTSTGGVITLNVNNSKNQFNLPQTGGLGLWIFTIAGGIAMAAGIIVFSVIRKNGKAKRRRR